MTRPNSYRTSFRALARLNLGGGSHLQRPSHIETELLHQVLVFLLTYTLNCSIDNERPSSSCSSCPPRRSPAPCFACRVAQGRRCRPQHYPGRGCPFQEGQSRRGDQEGTQWYCLNYMCLKTNYRASIWSSAFLVRFRPVARPATSPVTSTTLRSSPTRASTASLSLPSTTRL